MVVAGRSDYLTTFFCGQAWISRWPVLRAHTFACNWQQPLLEWFSGWEENDSSNYFIINLQEIMGPGRDRTRDPWNCSQTRICIQTRHVTDCVSRPDVNLFWSRSAPTQCRAWYGSKPFANAISTCKTAPLVRKKLNSMCIVCIHMNSYTCVECMHTNLVGFEAAYILSSLVAKLHRRQTCLSLYCSHINLINI